MDKSAPAPAMKLVKMGRFGFAAASQIWGPKKAREMFHQRRVEIDGEILAVPPQELREDDGR